MVQLSELVAYCDALLGAAGFQDYCPNGLQVEGRREVRRLVSGVTACQALVDAAAAAGADALLVHHGYFWKGEAPCVTGMKRNRLKALLDADMSLIAYHLPLDAHPELGNNARLGALLGLPVSGRFGRDDLGMYAELAQPLAAAELGARIAAALGREALHVAAGERPLARIGWCSGGAQGYIEAAAAAGLDAYISGEISEPTVHAARELGVDYFAAGHHATERYGAAALGAHLASRFGLEHTFIDVPNPA